MKKVKLILVVSILCLFFGGQVYDAKNCHQLGSFNIVRDVNGKEKKRKRTIKISLNMRNGLKYIAHAGGNKIAPANTIPSFLNSAKDQHIWAIETDVHNTSDGHLVLYHDDVVGPNMTINKKSRYYGKLFSRIPYSALKGVGIKGNRHYATHYTNQDLHIPTLMEYLNICKKYHKVAFIELKKLSSYRYIIQTIKEVKSVGMLKQTIITSKYLDELSYVHRIRDGMKIPLDAIYFHPLNRYNYRYIRRNRIAVVNMHIDGLNHYDLKTLHKMVVAYGCFVAYYPCRNKIKPYVDSGIDNLTVDSMAIYYFLKG